MRLNFIGGLSTTGGTGNLTIAAASGLALPALAFVADQTVEYSVIEYADATLATVVKAESGFGTISSGNVLTRTAPRTAWNGTTYAQAAVSALSFGTSNVRVYVTPTAEGGATAFPKRVDLSANYGINGYVIGANLISPFDFSTASLIVDYQYAVPVKLEAGFPLTQLGVEVTTAIGGASINCAIASLNPSTGFVGRVLAAANGLSAATTGVKMGSITSRLFAPGWYIQLLNCSAAGVSVRGCENFAPGPMGAFTSGARLHRGNYAIRPFADYVVGADAATPGSYGGADNIGWPILLMR